MPSNSTTPLTQPRSADTLRQIAESQINAEIAGAISPYQGEIGTLQDREQRALGDIGSMFGSLLPWVAGGAQRVAQSYQLAKQGQQDVFDAATAKLNALKQGRAAEAQALAQEIGGPVAASEFTAATQGAEDVLPETQANSLLHGLALAQGGVQEANAFAGRVFPALRTESEAKARSNYEDQITELQKQITDIKAQKTGKTNERYNELLGQERDYALQKAQEKLQEVQAAHDYANQKAQLKLSQTQAAHDWRATKAGIDQENQRIDLSRQQFELDQAGTTGKYQGNETQAAKEFRLQFGETVKEQNQNYQIQHAQVVNDQRALAVGLVDQALNPGTPYTQKTTQQIEVDAPPNPKKPPAGYFAQTVGGKTHWYKIVTNTQTVTPPSSTIRTPDQLYDYLIANGIPKSMAKGMVASRLGLGQDWTPHKKKGPPPNPKGKVKNQKTDANTSGYTGNPAHP